MKKGTKTILIIALILIGMGCIIMLASFFAGGSFRDLEYPMEFENGRFVHNDNENFDSVVETENYAYFSNEVQSIDIDIKAASFVISSGEEFTVRTENTRHSRIDSTLESDGTLQIEDTIYHRRKWLNFGFFDFGKFDAPRVFITIPNGTYFEKFDIEIAAGQLNGNNLDISIRESDFSVDAGSLELSGITSSKTEISADVGEITLSGTFTGHTEIECNVGSITLHTTGNIEDWSYAGEVKMGSIRINNNELNGIGMQSSPTQKNNHFDIECNLGDIDITVN